MEELQHIYALPGVNAQKLSALYEPFQFPVDFQTGGSGRNAP
jgi:hypothetical protein